MIESGIKIWTLHPSRRKGALMHASHYEVLKEYIFQSLRKQPEIVFQDMLEEAARVFPTDFEGSLSWHLLMVKLDLEARGIIQTHINNPLEKLQVLKLARSYRRRGQF